MKALLLSMFPLFSSIKIFSTERKKINYYIVDYLYWDHVNKKLIVMEMEWIFLYFTLLYLCEIAGISGDKYASYKQCNQRSILMAVTAAGAGKGGGLWEAYHWKKHTWPWIWIRLEVFTLYPILCLYKLLRLWLND